MEDRRAPHLLAAPGGAVVLLISLMSAAGIPAAPAADPSASVRSYEEVEAYVGRQLGQLNIPGAMLAIVEGDEIVHLRGFGRDRPGGDAPTAQTPFVICSLTKSFTALAVMQLVEAGRVELDAPVQRYLPWFRLADPAASAAMTVRHLLNQTSGLSQLSGMRPLADFDAGRDACERQAHRLSSVAPARQPGVSYEYSNMNYNLLGLIIEAVSGERYASYIEGHIFSPLRMDHSHASKAEAAQDGLAVGHTMWFGVPEGVPDLPLPTGSLPSGQLISSAEDMAHYLIAHLNGGRFAGASVLSAAGIAELHHPAVRADAMGVDMGEYAMGWFVEAAEDGTRIWHHGTAPDFFSYMAIVPEQDRGMVLLVNANHMVVNFALLDVCTAAAELLAGRPADASPASGVLWSVRCFLLIPLLQIIGVFVTLRSVRRWRREPSRRPRPGATWAVYIGLGSVPHLVLVASAVALPATGMLGFMLLFLPDLTVLVLVCGVGALVWLVLRSWLILKPAATTAQEDPDTRG